MRLLVLGGTVFVGNAVAAEAVRRGHDVVCAARGESGSVPDGATLVRVDRDAEDGLAPLTGEFDAVVDVATISHAWVDRALTTLRGRAGHWTFVSTVNVYADEVTPAQTPATGPLLDPLARHATRDDLRAAGEDGPKLYGAIKVASENAVREAMGDRSFVVRPGLISGPGDRNDRFGYWPARFVRGGRVLVPDVPEQLIQFIDVRDLAEWIVTAGETGLGGVYDGVGPAAPLGGVLREIAGAVGADAEFVPATPDELTRAEIQPWGGPRSLPLWLPSTDLGLGSHDASPSVEAGMPVRPLADAVAGALAWERELGLDRARTAGLSAEEEREVLAKLAR